MRGDQLARQWRVIRAIEASPNGLTVAEIADREETGIRTIYRDLEALQPKCHAKAQRAPRETFRVLLTILDIFLVPSDLFRKIIEKFSGKHPLRPWRLGVRGQKEARRVWKAISFSKNGMWKIQVFASPLVQRRQESE